MKAKLYSYNLKFKTKAKTSRNVFEERKIYYLIISENGKTGVGELAPLKKLSIDDVSNYEDILIKNINYLNEGYFVADLDLIAYPSIKFGLETAFSALKYSASQKHFDTSFHKGKKIKINGLVWMNEADKMLAEALQKIKLGYDCIKLKVGALDFDEECRLIERIRESHDAFSLEIRLDANGGFKADEAEEQLKELSRFEIHSIEQPIAPLQWDAMGKLCHNSKIDIALDEELILATREKKEIDCLDAIKPQYIILKPNLIGGFSSADNWIIEASKRNINWWATSALESNIGLNSIAQWVAKYNNEMPQGLGTGSLYMNNINSPLQVEGQYLHYNLNNKWDLKIIEAEGELIHVW